MSDPALVANCRTAVLPGFVIVLAEKAVIGPFGDTCLVFHQAREDAAIIFGILILLFDQRAGVGVMEQPRFKEGITVPTLAVDDVIDNAAQKGDVGTRTHR